MQQLNTKTVPVNLAAAIQIVSQVIRRRKKHDESPTAAADGTKPQPAMEATQRQPTFGSSRFCEKTGSFQAGTQHLLG